MRTPELPRRHAPRSWLILSAGLTASLAVATIGAFVVRSSPASAPPVRQAGSVLASRVVQRPPATAAAPAARRVKPAGVVADATAVREPTAVPRPARVSRGPSILDRLLAPGRFAYHEIARRAAARYRVELRLVMAIIASESGGNPEAVSPAGAIGLMQLMPETAERLGVDPWDPEQNVEGAVRYLSSQLSTFKSIDLSLIAYNAGPGFAHKYRRGDVELGAETRDFLTRVGYMLEPR